MSKVLPKVVQMWRRGGKKCFYLLLCLLLSLSYQQQLHLHLQQVLLLCLSLLSLVRSGFDFFLQRSAPVTSRQRLPIFTHRLEFVAS